MIKGHWFRVAGGRMETPDDPCCHLTEMVRCGRPQREHVQSVGEWMDPVHWFSPKLNRRCRACGRHWRHSTHRFTPAWWRLRR